MTDIEDEFDDKSKPVLVRIAEWTEWLPGRPDENFAEPGSSKSLMLYSGLTGMASGENERLVDLAIMGTGKNKKVTIKSETGGLIDQVYGLYTFQAVFAQNTSAPLLDSLLAAQKPPEQDSSAPRDKRDDLLVVQNGNHPLNRGQRLNTKKRSG